MLTVLKQELSWKKWVILKEIENGSHFGKEVTVRKMAHTDKLLTLLKQELSGKNGSYSEKLKRVKNGSHLKTGSHLKKWVTLAKMEKIHKMDHT